MTRERAGDHNERRDLCFTRAHLGDKAAYWRHPALLTTNDRRFSCSVEDWVAFLAGVG